MALIVGSGIGESTSSSDIQGKSSHCYDCSLGPIPWKELLYSGIWPVMKSVEHSRVGVSLAQVTGLDVGLQAVKRAWDSTWGLTGVPGTGGPGFQGQECYWQSWDFKPGSNVAYTPLLG